MINNVQLQLALTISQTSSRLINKFKQTFLVLANKLVPFEPEEVTALANSRTNLAKFLALVLGKLVANNVSLNNIIVTPGLQEIWEQLNLSTDSFHYQQLEQSLLYNQSLATLGSELYGLYKLKQANQAPGFFNQQVVNQKASTVRQSPTEAPDFSQGNPKIARIVNIMPSAMTTTNQEQRQVINAFNQLIDNIKEIDGWIYIYDSNATNNFKNVKSITYDLKRELTHIRKLIVDLRDRYLMLKGEIDYCNLAQEIKYIETRFGHAKGELIGRAAFDRHGEDLQQYPLVTTTQQKVNLLYVCPRQLPIEIKDQFALAAAQCLIAEGYTASSNSIADCFSLYTLMEKELREGYLQQLLTVAIKNYKQLPGRESSPTGFAKEVPRRLLASLGSKILEKVIDELTRIDPNLIKHPYCIISGLAEAKRHPQYAKCLTYLQQEGLNSSQLKLTHQQVADKYNWRIINNNEFKLPLVTVKFIKEQSQVTKNDQSLTSS
jgi:hypothetical protein